MYPDPREQKGSNYANPRKQNGSNYIDPRVQKDSTKADPRRQKDSNCRSKESDQLKLANHTVEGHNLCRSKKEINSTQADQGNKKEGFILCRCK